MRQNCWAVALTTPPVAFHMPARSESPWSLVPTGQYGPVADFQPVFYGGGKLAGTEGALRG